MDSLFTLAVKGLTGGMVGQKFHFFYCQSVRRVPISRAFQRKRVRSPTLRRVETLRRETHAERTLAKMVRQDSKQL